MTLEFDEPISAVEADAIRHERSPSMAIANDYEWELACGNSVSFIDSNGTFSVQYSCGSTRRLPWGFRLSLANQATVVGNINEEGLLWWRNGVAQPRNSPHNVPPNYQLHGTMSPVFAKNRIEFQDYITWRHNIGPGGTASLAFAGRLLLTN